MIKTGVLTKTMVYFIFTDDLQIQSIRLPLLSDAPGIGAMPQMFLAFGGANLYIYLLTMGVCYCRRE